MGEGEGEMGEGKETEREDIKGLLCSYLILAECELFGPPLADLRVEEINPGGAACR